MKKFGAFLSLLLAAAVGLFALTQTPRAAQNGAVQTDFTLRQQQQIEALVRQYILQHPEIIPEAITELQRREAVKILDSYRQDIETPFPGTVAGNPDGDVTIVEFFDFRCPYCRQAAMDVQRLIDEDAGIRVIYRDFPVLDRGGEPLSRRAALAALAAARQGKYVDFYKRLFDLPGRLSQELLVATVRGAGLDERQAVRDMESAELAAEVDKNLQLGRNLGLSGTPSYIIGDQIISGAVGYDALKAAVARARAGRGAVAP